MPTFSGGGLTREVGEFWNIELLDATSLNDAGFVLRYVVEDSRTKVDLCGLTDIPAAVNYRSTRDPHDMNFPNTIFKDGDDIGLQGIPVLREGWAKLKVATNNVVGKRGNVLVCTGSGKVDVYTPSAIHSANLTDTVPDIETRFNDLARIVGTIEEEDLIVGTTGAAGQDKVLTKLSIRATSLIT